MRRRIDEELFGTDADLLARVDDSVAAVGQLKDEWTVSRNTSRLAEEIGVHTTIAIRLQLDDSTIDHVSHCIDLACLKAIKNWNVK